MVAASELELMDLLAKARLPGREVNLHPLPQICLPYLCFGALSYPDCGLEGVCLEVMNEC